MSFSFILHGDTIKNKRYLKLHESEKEKSTQITLARTDSLENNSRIAILGVIKPYNSVRCNDALTQNSF